MLAPDRHQAALPSVDRHPKVAALKIAPRPGRTLGECPIHSGRGIVRRRLCDGSEGGPPCATDFTRSALTPDWSVGRRIRSVRLTRQTFPRHPTARPVARLLRPQLIGAAFDTGSVPHPPSGVTPRGSAEGFAGRFGVPSGFGRNVANPIRPSASLTPNRPPRRSPLRLSPCRRTGTDRLSSLSIVRPPHADPRPRG